MVEGEQKKVKLIKYRGDRKKNEVKWKYLTIYMNEVITFYVR